MLKVIIDAVAVVFMCLIGILIGIDMKESHLRDCEKENNVYRCEWVAQPIKEKNHDK